MEVVQIAEMGLIFLGKGHSPLNFWDEVVEGKNANCTKRIARIADR